ncbi:MAG TPA: hypothetical protein VNF46_05785 [Gammaproteobacteria bacterium]|nr:hypothetical protein [Gammaproteobacteria bacterium]
MSNIGTLIVNSAAYLVLAALMIAGMYLQVIPQSVGLVFITAILTHAGVNLPQIGNNSPASSANPSVSAGGSNAPNH